MSFNKQTKRKYHTKVPMEGGWNMNSFIQTIFSLWMKENMNKKSTKNVGGEKFIVPKGRMAWISFSKSDQ